MVLPGERLGDPGQPPGDLRDDPGGDPRASLGGRCEMQSAQSSGCSGCRRWRARGDDRRPPGPGILCIHCIQWIIQFAFHPSNCRPDDIYEFYAFVANSNIFKNRSHFWGDGPEIGSQMSPRALEPRTDSSRTRRIQPRRREGPETAITAPNGPSRNQNVLVESSPY